MPSTYRYRMIKEHEELTAKISKLNAFTDGELFPTLPVKEQRRLLSQLTHMNCYAAVLLERIETCI